MEGALVAAVVLLAATVFGLVRRHRDGMLRKGKVDGRLEPGTLGAEFGERATLVQFSSAFCAPCRSTRRILGEVAGMIDGVAHIEIDAEDRLDLVRELNVLRTPTVLVLDGEGTIVKRAAGQPRKADVVAALGLAIT
jgi:thiol-disulfide isomerase/thioredoxin